MSEIWFHPGAGTDGFQTRWTQHFILSQRGGDILMALGFLFSPFLLPARPKGKEMKQKHRLINIRSQTGLTVSGKMSPMCVPALCPVSQLWGREVNPFFLFLGLRDPTAHIATSLFTVPLVSTVQSEHLAGITEAKALINSKTILSISMSQGHWRKSSTKHISVCLEDSFGYSKCNQAFMKSKE